MHFMEALTSILLFRPLPVRGRSFVETRPEPSVVLFGDF